jgi:glycopeptide antibiotics resistance protein
MHAAPGHPTLSPRQRRQLAGLLLAWAAFVAYGSWVPLDFQARDPVAVWAALWQWTPAAALRAQRLDTAVNVLLTVPLGFGLALLRARPDGRVSWLARVGIVLAVLPLSLGVEWVQGFLPGRSESLGDVLAQTLGTALGVLLQRVFGDRARRRLAALEGALDARSRALQALHLYLLGLLLFALLPLDLTLDLGELYAKWRAGRVVLLPLGALRTPWSEAVYELLTDALLWLPVGLLWALDDPRRGLRSIVARALLLAAVLEGAQMLVLSRVSDVTDVVLAAVGAGLGALLGRRAPRLGQGDAARLRRACGLGLLLWLLAVVWMYGWPFALRWPAQGGTAFAEAFARVPFLTYFQRGEFGALNEMLRKILVFLPGGLLLRLRRDAGTKPAQARRRNAGLPLALLALLAFALEAMQVLLADRVADLTDAALAALGAALGWRLAGWLQGAARSAAQEGGRADSRGPAPLAAGTGLAHATSPRAVDAPTPLPPPRARVWPQTLVRVLGLALLLWLLARLPGVPYNVAKLIPPGAAGLLAAAGVAAAAGWIAALPVFYVRAPGRVAAALPLLLLLHGLVAFAMLRPAVPLPMLHKVIGSPILAWPGMSEDLLRYLALHAALMLPLCGAAAVVAVVQEPARLNRLVYWALVVAVLAWPLHWAVVGQAATDNLVELMRGGGFMASSSLALAIMALGVGGAALASLRRGRVRVAALLLLVAALATPAALYAGLEPAVFKYGRVFSALQFILSAGRDAYASGPELAVRYAAAYAGLTLALAWLQAPGWRQAWPRAAP